MRTNQLTVVSDSKIKVYDFKFHENEKNQILTPSRYMTFEMFAKNMK